jgi:hypothetical protein
MAKGRGYTPEQIEAGLLALAKTGGNTHQAAAVLKEHGPRTIESSNLSRLRRAHYARYEEICKQVYPEIERAVKQRFVDNLALAQEAQSLAIEKAIEQLHAGQAKNPAGAAKDLSIAMGVNFDKVQLIDGKPTHINGNTNADELMSKLQRLAPAFSSAVIDSTAEELPSIPTQSSTNAKQPSSIAKHASVTDGRSKEAD